MTKKRIAVLGSTGSIGTSTLQVVKHLSDSIEVVALAAHSNIDLLEEQVRAFSPKIVAVADPAKASLLRARCPQVEVLEGDEGVNAIACHADVEFVVMAIVGVQALEPTMHAIKAKKTIGLANKEVLVSAGEFLGQLAIEHGTPIVPIDSEHSALFQCLQGIEKEEVGRMILTASGGPFRNHSMEELANVSLKDALTHPTWSMGQKVTIDSSTMMNKGLEIIEARWLFDLPLEKIDVVIHPQSLVHSFIECVDGSLLAQLSEPSMVYPIQYALTYPRRQKGYLPPFDFTKARTLEFFPPDTQKFPSLVLAYEALKQKGSFPCYLNAANEVLVNRFINREISWISIIQKLEVLLERHRVVPTCCVEDILDVDEQARAHALTI